ncbi:MAG: Methylenetetrahydrofolate--tRNA-(uracil-5-)-methyltransferase trmFO, partial [Bacteriovoracaceae bacterium]|nr:Methylenetetrahydrofolate--tRNA-(uracil-5-)-methyltransferase trmFO [Bacteriovoracaceae bacterium]
QLKVSPTIYMAGQITGSEGYTEALASGHYAALQMLNAPSLPENTAIRSMVRYLITSEPKYFQPMNFNFGLLPPVMNPESKIKGAPSGKRFRNVQRSERALKDMREWIEQNPHFGIGASTSGPMNSLKNPLSAPDSVLTPTELAS